MKVVADICVTPLTGRVSVREEVALAHALLVETGCTVMLHGYGTNIEGDIDVVLGAIKRIHQELHARGVARLSTAIKLGSRIDKEQTIEGKLQAVHDVLED